MQLRRLLSSCNELARSNEKRAKVTVKGLQGNFSVGCWPWAPSQRNDVTSLQVEHPASVLGTFAAPSWLYGLSHSDNFVVHANMDSSIVEVVDLRIDVIPSRGGYSQFSVFVRHASCNMTVRGAERPVLDH